MDNVYEANERFNKIEEGPITIVEFLMKNGEKYELPQPFAIGACKLRVRQSMEMTSEFFTITDSDDVRTFILRKSEIAGISLIEVE